MRAHVYTLILLLSVAIFSCSKSKTNAGDDSGNGGGGSGSGGTGTERVILGGLDQNDYPFLYEGSKKLPLDTNGKRYYNPRKIYVSGSDIYAGDASLSGYWKNGVWQSLQSLPMVNEFNLRDFAVSGSDVYVLGNKFNSFNNTNSVSIWKNGSIIYEQSFSSGYEATKLFVDNVGSPYFYFDHSYNCSGTPGNRRCTREVGFANIPGGQTSGLWRATYSTPTSTGLSGQALFFNGFNTYSLVQVIKYSGSAGITFAGNYFIWKKNGFQDHATITPLVDNWFLRSPIGSCIDKDTVYTSGVEDTRGGFSIGRYWKNSEPTVLFDQTPTNIAGHVGGIAVKNRNVYVAGRPTNTSTSHYWKNGNPVTIPGVGPLAFSSICVP